jgi:hypothetical protein
MSGIVNYNNKTVSDEHLKTVLQRIADLYQNEVKVTSGDRGTALSVGAGTGSLHLQNRAVDFHVVDELDANVYAKLKLEMNAIFDSDKRYEVIHHGPYTETNGQHIHIGRSAAGTAGVRFEVEGLTKKTQGIYTTQGTFSVSPDVDVVAGAKG